VTASAHSSEKRSIAMCNADEDEDFEYTAREALTLFGGTKQDPREVRPGKVGDETLETI
jgi:hypothetical protein